MRTATVATLIVVLVAVGLGVAVSWLRQGVDPAAGAAPAGASPAPDPSTPTHPAPVDPSGFLYGRVTTVDGVAFEGRLRFGGLEEAFWTDAFNGAKETNRWVALAPPEAVRERRSFDVFGLELGSRERSVELDRPFQARFGDIASIEAVGDVVRVELKNGTAFGLDRFGADDLADGVRVWDATRGVTDLHEWRIRSIEFRPTPAIESAPYRLHGSVRTTHGEFVGFIVWNRTACVGTDTLALGGENVRLGTVRSVARDARGGVRVTLLDGREIALPDSRELGRNHRGISVEDPRFGRVSIPWDATERIDVDSRGSGPGYDDFPPGRALAGTVVTRAGARLSGRLVYDLDESETAETLDAPRGGLDYTVPFGRIASIVLPERGEDGGGLAVVTLADGHALDLERSGDLADGNPGMLVFAHDGRSPAFVPWVEVARIDFDRP